MALEGAARQTPNRLADESSPYLQLHADNPVDWYPWGDEALGRARLENKPIFLSVGYSTCYWCHVMEREVFSDPEIAALMNQWFVNIKVDREERPDIDEIYMTATQLLTGEGGWPNSVFLTPELEPFYGGTYFPPEDQGNRPGFSRVLQALHEGWIERRAEIETQAARFAATLQEVLSVPPRSQTDIAPSLAAPLSFGGRQGADRLEWDGDFGAGSRWTVVVRRAIHKGSLSGG